MLLQIPPGAETYELQNRMIWFENNEILFARPKQKYIEPTLEDTRTELKMLREIIGERKVCIIGEADVKAKPPKKEVRDLLSKELDNLFKAMAIVTRSPLSKMIANLFFSFRPPKYPTRLFSNEHDARAWIHQFK